MSLETEYGEDLDVTRKHMFGHSGPLGRMRRRKFIIATCDATARIATER
jgi:hypothetical protein